MFITYCVHCFVCCYIVLSATFVISSQIPNKIIALNKSLSYENKELYGDFIYLNRSSILRVNFSDVSEKLSFIVFQVHSHLYNVTLYRNENGKGNNVTATNIGLHSLIDNLDTFHIQNHYEDVDLKLFVSVHGYTEYDPMPGGCNMEYPNPIAPYMRANKYKNAYIMVEAPAPQSKSDISCSGDKNLDIIFFILYLPQNNYDRDVYFEALRKMTTYKNLMKNGRTIPQSLTKYWTMRRMLSAYPGNGAIYVALAYQRNGPGLQSSYSVYVPTHSYACSPLVAYDCELMDDSFSMLLNASLFFVGLFMCYYGHRFFKTQIMIIGFVSGLIVTYILLSVIFGIDGPELVAASALSGLCMGALMLVSWWIYGLPISVIVLSSADIGFLIASFLYYISLGETPYQILQENFNFWCLFILTILLIVICLISTSHLSNLLCCAVVGSYTTIYPIDYYLGSNLKYILNNTIRRATVPEFNMAVIVPPFQWRDWFLSFVWLTLATTGFCYQYQYHKGRPPFPPPPRSVRAVPEDPAEPIMPAARGSRAQNVLINRSGLIDERTPLLA